MSVADTKPRENIGNVHWEKGDRNAAEQYYREAHNIYLMSLIALACI